MAIVTGADARIEEFKIHGQGHVFAHWADLSEEEQAQLFEQASAIDLDELADLVKRFVGASGHALDLEGLEPAPYEAHPKSGGDQASWDQATEQGEQALRAGRVAAFTVAGGQGTRLGYDGPKGTYPVTPIRKLSLFAVFAGKLKHASTAYGVDIPWLIMTSELNHEQTVAFFEQNGHFGLDPEKVRFFRQGLMPAVDTEGKVILESKSCIAMSPDGHGGSLRALVRSGATDAMKGWGCDILSYFQVDNPVVRCIDPAFIGFHLLGNSQMSSKMVPKAYPMEKVGHFCKQGDRNVVIEYSDMPDELAELRNEDEQLRYRAGSIAIHILAREFVEKVGSGESGYKLPFHRAHKKIAALTDSGETVKPDAPNGYKFEMFVFDALPFAERPVIIETLREDDFSPVKNAEGKDSPETCHRDQLRQFVRWLRHAGVEVETDAEGAPSFDFEVAADFAVDEASFAKAWAALENKPAIEAGVVIGA